MSGTARENRMARTGTNELENSSYATKTPGKETSPLSGVFVRPDFTNLPRRFSVSLGEGTRTTP
jgi:hypothetical protein